MDKEEIKLDSETALAEHVRDLYKWWNESHYLLVRVRTGKQRTLTQNRALHLFCDMLADKLNAHGMDMRVVMKPHADLWWTMESVKENLWKPYQVALLGKHSTTEADRVEYTQIHEAIGKHMAEKFNFQIPDWPKKRDDDKKPKRDNVK